VKNQVKAHVKGFTLIELLITVAILGLLASVAAPLAELTLQRGKETELRRSLREVREAIDAYKRAAEDGRIEKKADSSGYPPTLAALVQGAKDITSPENKTIYFLRRVPPDPLTGEEWGLRSSASPADRPEAGKDVFDIYSKSEAVGLNGKRYREW
jgi:general secretion pathway protein G